MDAPPIVSVILPCFNAADTLPECLESLAQQSFQHWEIVAVDDGSIDETPEILRAFAAQYANVRVISTAHSGIVAALQRACAEAKGAYLARMDADDVADAARLAQQVSMMERGGLDLCGTRVAHWGSGPGEGLARYIEWINGIVDHDSIVRDLFIECPIPHPTFMMSRSAYEASGGYQDQGWPEDYDLIMRFYLAGFRFGKPSEPLLRWRHSEGRLSRIDERYSPEKFRRLKRHYLALSHLSGGRPFYQWGAGAVGKNWLREWEAEKPQAVVDLHPRKIGKIIHGVRVIAPEDLPGPGAAFTVVAVGAPGAREEIREWFNSRGYEELRDYVFLA